MTNLRVKGTLRKVSTPARFQIILKEIDEEQREKSASREAPCSPFVQSPPPRCPRVHRPSSSFFSPRYSPAIPVRAYARYVARATAVGQGFDDRQPCKAGRLGRARLGRARLGPVRLGRARSESTDSARADQPRTRYSPTIVSTAAAFAAGRIYRRCSSLPTQQRVKATDAARRGSPQNGGQKIT